MSAVLEQHSDQLQSQSWKKDGALLASTCKVSLEETAPEIYCNGLAWPYIVILNLYSECIWFKSLHKYLPGLGCNFCSCSVRPLDAASGSQSLQHLSHWTLLLFNCSYGTSFFGTPIGEKLKICCLVVTSTQL